MRAERSENLGNSELHQRVWSTARERLRGRWHYIILFLLFVVAFAYTPPRWQDWNQNSRFNLTRALVDDQTVRIDRYVANTGDYAEIDGRIYTDKAPGLSFMAVPVYGATRVMQPLGLSALSDRLAESESFSGTLNPDGDGLGTERVDVAVALYISTIVTVALPAALMLLCIAAIVAKQSGCRTAGVLTALILGLATPVFAYSQAFYGHVPAAACIVGALTLLVLRPTDQLSVPRLLAVGALLGWSVVVEFPAAVAALPVAAWAVWLSGRRAIVYGVAGALPALLVLAVYDLVAFGTITPVGYQHSALWQDQHSVGFMSLTYPRWATVSGLLWSEFRGLLFYAPVLFLAIPGIVIAWRNRRQRAMLLVAVSSFLMFFLFVASSGMWWGGFSVGPRYLVPALPMLALPLGLFIARMNGETGLGRVVGLALTLVLAGISGMLVWMTTFAGQNYPPDSTRRPIGDYVWPRVSDGDLARNIGMAAGLDGVASIVPLVLAVLVAVAVLGLYLIASERNLAGETAVARLSSSTYPRGDDLVTQLSSAHSASSISGSDNTAHGRSPGSLR